MIGERITNFNDTIEDMKTEAGYKQSEMGLIPSDWIPLTFKDICWVNQGLQIAISSRLKFPTPESKVYITIQYLNDAKTIEYIDDYVSSVCCVKNDILMTRTGNTGIVISGVDGVFHNNFFKINFDHSKIDKDFLVYYLNQEIIQRIILMKAGTSTIPDLNHRDFYSIPIVLPPNKAEQTTIATTLGDADTLITFLEKLITKKRMIKQGAMQKLLAPKKGWEVKKIGEIGKTYGGLSGKSKGDFEKGEFPYIPFMNIMSNPVIDPSYFDYVNIGSNENQNQTLKGDLFFNGSSETPEEVGMCSVLIDEIPNLYLNSFCFGFRLNKDLKNDGLYLSYYFRSSEGRKLFYSLAQGATRYNLSKSNFMRMEISLPKHEEQIYIAKVLKDMDSELNVLEKKLEKQHMIKAGMMQQLLTGKIRLV